MKRENKMTGIQDLFSGIDIDRNEPRAYSPQWAVDTRFDFRSDTKGRDIDQSSPMLRRYHKMLWSKALPDGRMFNLSAGNSRTYLYHHSRLGEFFLGSDSITNSYRTHKRKRWIVEQIPEEVDELYVASCTIGAYIVFPNVKAGAGKLTINQARGCNRYIDDRFDLTLECIRRFYLGQTSPLHDVLLEYSTFFDLFGTFTGYVDFFLLQDLLDASGAIRFYLPFNDFASLSVFATVDDYRQYNKRAICFIHKRNARISKWAHG